MDIGPLALNEMNVAVPESSSDRQTGAIKLPDADW
jgi:hypothetical protein